MSDEFSPDPGGGDSVTEVTTTGWLQRLGQSIVGALFGLVLVIGSIVLLSWNEGRAVEAIRALDQGARQVVEVKADALDTAAEGKLVHGFEGLEVGDKLRVKLISTDVERGFIDFVRLG